MNKARRELLNQAERLLDEASELISQALDQEQDCLDNLPENLQDRDIDVNTLIPEYVFLASTFNNSSTFVEARVVNHSQCKVL